MATTPQDQPTTAEPEPSKPLDPAEELSMIVRQLIEASRAMRARLRAEIDASARHRQQRKSPRPKAGG